MPSVADELAELRSRKVTKTNATKLKDAAPLSTPEQEEAVMRAKAKEDKLKKKEAETRLHEGVKGVSVETDYKLKQGAKKKEDMLKKKEAESILHEGVKGVSAETDYKLKQGAKKKEDKLKKKEAEDNLHGFNEAKAAAAPPTIPPTDPKDAAAQKAAAVVEKAVADAEKAASFVEEAAQMADVVKVDGEDSDEIPQLEEQAAAAVAPGSVEDANATAEGKSTKQVQNRNEKKSRKMMQRLGMNLVPGIARVTIKTGGRGLFVIDQPDVYQSPGKTSTCVVFGEARQGGGVPGDAQAQQQAAAAKAATAAASLGQAGVAEDVEVIPQVETEEEVVEEVVDETGIEPKDVDLIMSQASCSRAKAVAALKENDGDLVNAIMSLTT